MIHDVPATDSWARSVAGVVPVLIVVLARPRRSSAPRSREHLIGDTMTADRPDRPDRPSGTDRVLAIRS
jgi:hypothetical protein